MRKAVSNCLLPLVFAAFAIPAEAGTTVVATGLRNPRGLAFGPEGGLYVAEAGSGGTGPCVFLNPVRGTQCLGMSGAITRIDLASGTWERIVDGLPSITSLGPPAGFGATGPHDISFLGRGGAYVTIGFGGNPAQRTAFGNDGAALGQLIKVSAGGEWKTVADIAAHEAAANPDAEAVDTNAYGVLALPGLRLVTDAGGNDLVEAAANGATRTLAVFGRIPIGGGHTVQAVPTTVALGPDGALYVGVLSGAPFTPGAARVYRIPADGGAPEALPYPFFSVIDIAFGPDGSLYVLQIFPGLLERIAPDGTRSTVAAGLTMPGSVVVAEDGTVYVSVNSVNPTAGMVLKITP